MFYTYFHFFNWFNTLFGVRKPFLRPVGWKSKIWSLIIVTSIIITHLLAINFDLKLNWESDMEKISSLNNMIVNVIVIILNIYHGKNLFLLYETFNKIFLELQLNENSVKKLAIKLYLWISLQSIIFSILIILEVVYEHPPYVLLIRIPIFLFFVHILVHLCLILSFLKVLNLNLMNIFQGLNKIHNNFIISKNHSSEKKYLYFVSTEFYFIDVKQRTKFDLKFLCTLYDELCTGLHLLQLCHGVQILFTIWLMFSSAVLTITLVVNNQTNTPWLEIIKGTQVLCWFALGCYVDDGIRQEVERTNLLILKYLIDFQCDPGRKNVLQTFRVLVNTNRLQFTACNLYHVNFTTLLATLVSVITYSIISIQLF